MNFGCSILFLLISVFSIGQKQNVTDSLMLQLEGATDTSRYQVLRSLSKEYSKSDLDKSLSYAMQCLTQAKEMDYNEGIITATNLVGNCFTRKGDYETAIEKYIESSKLATQVQDTFLVSQSYNNIGAIQLYIENNEKAIEYFKKALEIRALIGTPVQIASTLSNIGEAFRRSMQLDSSEFYFSRAYSIYKEDNNTRGLSMVLNNIGNVFAAKNDYRTAIEYYEKSLFYKKKMNKPRDFAIACNNLGEMYFELKNYQKSLEYFNLSEKHALESQSIIDIKTAYKGLSKVFEKNKQWKKSLTYYKLFNQLSDSLLNIEKANSVAEFEIKYQMIEKEKEIAKLETEKELKHLIAKQKDLELVKIQKEKDLEAKENEFKSSIIISSIIVLALLGIVVVVILKRNKERKNDNLILTNKNHLIEEKSKEILDSIIYAKRIQNAILPPKKVVKQHLPDSFILYKPKDIVAGDFYWLENKNDTVMFAAADCTGHGVPGAMVSVICNNGLNRSVREHGLTNPGEILDKTREIIIEEFEKSEEDVKDGMDIALVSLAFRSKLSVPSSVMKNKEAFSENPEQRTQNEKQETVATLQYAGAHNPLWIIRKVNNLEPQLSTFELIEIKADKQPIGKFQKAVPFTTHSVDLEKGDTIYIFSDGYVDQFGGERGKKFKTKALRSLLLSIQNKSMTEQKEFLETTFETWKGDLEQIDDVCVIGVRV